MNKHIAAIGFIVSLIPIALFLISLLPNPVILVGGAWHAVFYLVIPLIALGLSVYALVKFKDMINKDMKWAATSGTTLSVLSLIQYLITVFF